MKNVKTFIHRNRNRIILAMILVFLTFLLLISPYIYNTFIVVSL